MKIDFRRWMSKKFEAAAVHQFVGKAHSLRIGGATTLFELEGAEAVKSLGGWATEVFRHYVHLTREQRSAYVRRMSQHRARPALSRIETSPSGGCARGSGVKDKRSPRRRGNTVRVLHTCDAKKAPPTLQLRG